MSWNNIFKTSILVLVILYFIKAFNISYPISVVTTTRSSELSVVGEGKVDAVPDTAIVDAGISVTNARAVTDVQRTINDVNNKIISALQKLGIQKKDITTSNYSINPNYEYIANQNRINGYNGNVNISIKVRNTKLVATVIDAATKAGANQVQGARFTIDNPQKYRERARNLAIQNAKNQAKKLASQLGIKLGKIVNIVESTPTDGPIIYPMSRFDAGIGGAGTPQIETGSQTITSQVTLFFERK